MQVAKKWTLGPTRFQPKSMMPKNPASSMKAMTVSKPRMLPKNPPVAAAKGPQLVPNWNSRGTPLTTPTAKLRRKSRPQKRVWW